MKKILVTGGNKGIGKAVCQLLLEKYPDVHVILGSRDKGRGKEAVKDITVALGAELCQGRLETLTVDTASDESIQRAASQIQGKLYGIVNNAGVQGNEDVALAVDTNYFGPRRVNDALLSKMERPGGRIVNIASASGPMFVAKCTDKEVVASLNEPWTIPGGLAELDLMAKTNQKAGALDAYGFSKALLSAYTCILAKEEPDLVVNSVTPGFIDTDMTAGWGASNPPAKGAIPPVWLLMSDDLTKVPTGRYYGSDCIRSPLNAYRGPGDPVYEGPDGK